MYKIMLADDEGIVIDALSFIIQKNFGDSCMIESAKTGRSVIELADRFRPDIAFMDIQMPGINGIEAMKEIKQTCHNTVFIILFLVQRRFDDVLLDRTRVKGWFCRFAVRHHAVVLLTERLW